MKKFLQLFMMIAVMATAGACSKEDDGPDPDVIWDIYPGVVTIELVDEEGNNLLNPAVDGNWVGEPMWIGIEDKSYDAIWNYKDLIPETRYYMPYFYGLIWCNIRNDEQYHLHIGEFAGEQNHDLKLTFGITAINTVHEFEYISKFSWKNKEPHREAYILYKDQIIDGEVLTLTIPKRLN